MSAASDVFFCVYQVRCTDILAVTWATLVTWAINKARCTSTTHTLQVLQAGASSRCFKQAWTPNDERLNYGLWALLSNIITMLWKPNFVLRLNSRVRENGNKSTYNIICAVKLSSVLTWQIKIANYLRYVTLKTFSNKLLIISRLLNEIHVRGLIRKFGASC